MGGKQETGEEGEEEVVTVTIQGFARAAAPLAAEEDLHAEKNSQIKYIQKTVETNRFMSKSEKIKF